MTQLEKRLKNLEDRIKVLEQKQPIVNVYPYYQPSTNPIPMPNYPNYPNGPTWNPGNPQVTC